MSAWSLGTEEHQARILAMWVAATSVVFVLASTAIVVVSPLTGPARFADEQFVWLVPVIAFIAVGAFIAVNRPSNAIGWVFSWLGLLSAASFGFYAIGAGILREGSGAAWVTVGGDVLNTASIVTFVALAAHLFPNGEVVSPRWRWGVWVAFAAGLMGGVAAVLNGGWGGDPEQAAFPSPLRDDLGSVPEIMGSAFWPLMLLAWGSGGAALIVRFVRSKGPERAQMKWLIIPVFILLTQFLAFLPEDMSRLAIGSVPLSTFFTSLGLSSIPIAVAIAVVRHGLYDIDLVISRSLVVAGLGGFITVVYVLVVVGVGAVVGAGDEPNLVLQIVATGLVAVLFQPVRQRLRKLADRLVYGYRASPYEVLSTFSRGATSHAESSLEAIAGLLSAGTGADPATVWLRVGDRVVPVASSSESNGAEPVRAGEGFLQEIPGERVVPVLKDGEVLGALAISKPRGEQVTPQDEDLMERLAAGAGVVLHNNRLTVELQARLEELRESRRRLVSAQDETRRKLERDLHDGAQQQLVALKVKLGLAKSLAAKAGAHKSAELLDRLSAEADEAVDTLRDLARGIYPPLLEAEGLSTAVEAQARKAALPITVHAAGLGRYDQEIESAVYFCILEAMSNAAKYSGAKSVHIRLEDQGGTLRFAVEDDGRGFEADAGSEGTGLQGMEDRLDTINGSLTIKSEKDKGTVVSGSVPLTTGIAA